jgi:hypothetical protein
MASKDFWVDRYDFFGHGSFTATQADNGPLRIADTSVAGTPTYVFVDGSSSGELAVDMDTQAEVQNVCVYQGNILQYDIDKITEVSFRVKMNQAAMDATSMFAIGLTGDRNDDIDLVAQAAIFRVVGADDTTAVVVETDDGTNEQNDVATGKTLINVYKDLKISFATGTNDVRFFIDGAPVATSTTFDMSAYTASLQLFMQIQKTSDANADGFTIDWAEVRGRR